MKKKQTLAEKKKTRNMEIIMHDALHYFEKNGYDNTTIDQLCEAAMISQSTFFNYFGSKETIIEMVMRDGLNDYYAYFEKLVAEEDEPFNVTKKGLLFMCDATEKYCNITSVFHRLALQKDEFKEIEKEHNELGANMVEYAFEKKGRKCSLERDVLMNLLGGCFTNPFVVLPPQEAGTRIRKTIITLLDQFEKELGN